MMSAISSGGSIANIIPMAKITAKIVRAMPLPINSAFFSAFFVFALSFTKGKTRIPAVIIQIAIVNYVESTNLFSFIINIFGCQNNANHA